MFHVHQWVVFDTLHWLKEHNPKYYGDIKISEAWMVSLPEDNVPKKIAIVIQQSKDVGVVEKESDGYIP